MDEKQKEKRSTSCIQNELSAMFMVTQFLDLNVLSTV